MLADNYDWLSKLRAHRLPARCRQALLRQRDAREGVGRSPAWSATGISYTEFSYHAAAGLRLPGAAPSATAARCRSAAATSGATSRRASSSSDESRAPRRYGLTLPLVTKADGQQVREDRDRRPSGSTRPDVPVRVLPVLAQQRRRGGRRLPPVLHLPAAREIDALSSVDRPGARKARGSAGVGARGHPHRARRGRPGRSRGDHGDFFTVTSPGCASVSSSEALRGAPSSVLPASGDDRRGCGSALAQRAGLLEASRAGADLAGRDPAERPARARSRQGPGARDRGPAWTVSRSSQRQEELPRPRRWADRPGPRKNLFETLDRGR